MAIPPDIFETFPVLKNDRLTLRDIRPEDAEAIFRMRSNGRVNRFIARPAMERLNDALALAERTRKAYENRQAIGWAGVLRESGTIIGTCGYNHIDFDNHRAEIGGELSVDYWGKNIAAEAVTMIVRFGLERMNLHSIEAKVSPDNRGAIFLLENLGFIKEAHYRDRIFFGGNYSDMAVYTLLEKAFKG